MVAKVSIACMIAFAVALPAVAQETRLDEELVRKIEAQIVLPTELPGEPQRFPLNRRGRYYARGKGSDSRFIYSCLMAGDKNDIGIHIVEKVACGFDGGCGVIWLRYDTVKERIVEIFCNPPM